MLVGSVIHADCSFLTTALGICDIRHELGSIETLLIIVSDD
jgi:hypothetical protein